MTNKIKAITFSLIPCLATPSVMGSLTHLHRHSPETLEQVARQLWHHETKLLHCVTCILGFLWGNTCCLAAIRGRPLEAARLSLCSTEAEYRGRINGPNRAISVLLQAVTTAKDRNFCGGLVPCVRYFFCLSQAEPGLDIVLRWKENLAGKFSFSLGPPHA